MSRGGLLALLLFGCGGSITPTDADAAGETAVMDTATDAVVEAITDVGADRVDPPATGCATVERIPTGPVTKGGGLLRWAVEGSELTVIGYEGFDHFVVGTGWTSGGSAALLPDGAKTGALELATVDGSPAWGAFRDWDSLKRPGFIGAQFLYRAAKDAWKLSGSSGGWGFLGDVGPQSPVLMLVYPGASKWRYLTLLDDGQPEVRESIAFTGRTILPPPKGWLSPGMAESVRYTAVGKYFLRTGRNLAPAVLDLDGLVMRPVEGALAIADFGGVGVNGTQAWVHGVTSAGPTLQLVDVPGAKVLAARSTSTMLVPATAMLGQDMVVVDGDWVWTLRFTTGEAAIARVHVKAGTAEVFKLSGPDLDLARSLFVKPTPRPGFPLESLSNGNLPPENLKAMRLGDSDLVVAQVMGAGNAVRIRAVPCL